MVRKVLFFFLFSFFISISFLFPVSSLSDAITDFDGNYNGSYTLTFTTNVPSDPPQIITETETENLVFTVLNGQILGWGKGFMLNKAGQATLTIPIEGYGNITATSYFSWNTSTGVITATGQINGTFPSAYTVVSGKFTASYENKFKFTIFKKPWDAQIGKKYPLYSFCVPRVEVGKLCGIFPKSVNPSGGRPPYTFRLKIGSDFLPTGMILNSRTGEISGTPKAGQKATKKHLVVCAYDSSSALNGVCRTTTLVLTR